MYDYGWGFTWYFAKLELIPGNLSIYIHQSPDERTSIVIENGDSSLHGELAMQRDSISSSIQSSLSLFIPLVRFHPN